MNKDIIVSQQWLLEHIDDVNVKIIDCRFSLANTEEGSNVFNEGHIKGALYCDLEKDMSSSVGIHGGRHPLPSKQELVSLFSRLGIDEHSKVVAYDDQGGAMAARFWFLLTYAGHQNAYILDNGFQSWKEQGFPITNKVTEQKPSQFIASFQDDLLVNMEEVKDVLANDRVILIDSREESRYKGKHEPIDRIAGHIPGAINLFWKNNISIDGTWLDRSSQSKRLEKLSKEKEYIVYCGSGVTAIPNFIALLQIGVTKVKLYPGSWSDWISYEDNPISRIEE